MPFSSEGKVSAVSDSKMLGDESKRDGPRVDGAATGLYPNWQYADKPLSSTP
jgi:hypothetical protein